MPHTSTTTRRSGFTLVELLVVVAVLVLLLALLLPAIHAVRDRARIDKARAQMQMIAMAIDEYARFWPAPPSNAAAPCARGLPPWRFWELWEEDNDWDYILMANDRNHWLMANECLAWCLTAEVGTGPYLKQPPSGLVEYVTDASGTPIPYPPPGNTAQRVRLLDPWGQPYYYCWTAADGIGLLAENLSQMPDRNTLDAPANLAQKFMLVSLGPNKETDYQPGPDGLFGTQDDEPGDDLVYGQGT